MNRIILLLLLALPALLSAQAFQKVTFHQSSNKRQNTVVAGQRIKVFVLGPDGYLKGVKGKLQDVRNDSIFLLKNRKTLGFALNQVEKIKYRPVSVQKLILTLVLVGLGLFFLFLILAVAWLDSGARSSGNYLAVIAGAGYVLLLLGPIIGLFSNKSIKKPASNSTIELFHTTAPEQVP